jgi:phenylacetic acid degradation operon negative regulatory protein
MAIKERRTKIMFAVAVLSNINTTYVEINDMVENVFDISLNPKTKATISKLIKEEYIVEKPSDNPEQKHSNQYLLTEKGFYHICLEFPFFRFMKDSWDGKWRVLSYEIPEKKRDLRDRLRREVAGWGLGPWHRSFWVTPHPIIPHLSLLVSSKEEEKYIQAFEADHVFGNRDILIEKVWEKSTLEKTYRELFKSWHEILSKDEDRIQKFQQIVSLYIDVLRKDPGLPVELVGENWIGFEAHTLFREIRNILFSPTPQTS